MRKVNIMTDYTCDLPDKLLEENNVKAFPLYISLGNATYKDHVELSTKDLFVTMEKTGEFPKTAAPTPDFISELVSEYPEDEDVIYIGLGSKFSSVFNNACIAAKDHPNFYPIDSLNLSTGTGLLVMKAIKFRNEGLSALEIKEKILELVPRVRAQFAIDTLKFLHKGGRCSGTARILGVALRIKPIIRVINGFMEVTKKPMGFFNKALDAQIDNIVLDKDNLDSDYIFITHPDAHSDALYLKNKLKAVGITADHIIETSANGVIASHCGPRTIGVLYLVNK